MIDNKTPSAAGICFGLDPETDRRSFVSFVRCLADPGLLERLAAELSSEEINAFVDQVTGLLKRHLSHSEFHRHFLGDGR